MNHNPIAIGLWFIVWLFGIVFLHIYECVGGCVTSTPPDTTALSLQGEHPSLAAGAENCDLTVEAAILKVLF